MLPGVNGVLVSLVKSVNLVRLSSEAEGERGRSLLLAYNLIPLKNPTFAEIADFRGIRTSLPDTEKLDSGYSG